MTDWTFHSTKDYGWPRWAIKVEPYGGDWKEAYSFDWVAVEVSGWEGSGTWTGDVSLLLFGEVSSSGFEKSPDKVEPSATGYLKWDGCMEVEFAHEHHCGEKGARGHYDSLIASVYEIAKERMPRFDQETGA